jgi:hypothetical protein
VTDATSPDFEPAEKFYGTPVAAEPAQANGHANGMVTDGATTKPQLKSTTPREVLQRWKTTGPLVHEPTGFSVLDERTGGGLVYGSRVYFLGAPDAGKTAFIVQLLDTWARRGVVVGLLAVDEEDDDVVTRLVQRLVLPPAPADLDMDGPLSRDRFTRQDCEHRVPNVVEQMEQAMGDPPVRLYNADWTIEAAAADLDKFAKSLVKEGEPPRRVVLFVDSIQTVTCTALMAALREPSPREAITANVKAVRTVATTYRMLVGATSEMARDFYRDEEKAEKANDIAGGKESGSIEYSGRVLVSVRSVKDDPDLVHVRLPKNKYGPSYRKRGDEFYLRLDRASQTLRDADPPARSETQSTDGPGVRRAAVLKLVRRNPGRGTKALRQAAKDAGLRIGNDALDAVIEELLAEGAIEDRGGEAAHKFHLVPEGARHPGGTQGPGGAAASLIEAAPGTPAPPPEESGTAAPPTSARGTSKNDVAPPASKD